MNLFISWSGERSEAIAKALHSWIKCVIQSIDPFFSPRDISGGSIRINKLHDKLASTNAGIICLTPENQHNPWIQFEAGALAKGLSESRVFVLLIGMESHQVSGPLSSFNHTSSVKDGIQKMVFNLNELLGEKQLPIEIVSRVFEKNYADLESEIKSISLQESKEKKPPKRDSDEIQNEMLDLLRGISKRVSKLESKPNETSYYSPPPIPDIEFFNSLEPKALSDAINFFKRLDSNQSKSKGTVSKLSELLRNDLQDSVNDGSSSSNGGV